MKFGYWMPVFGGWLRNIRDEGMEANWDYVKRLTQRSEQTGWASAKLSYGPTGRAVLRNIAGGLLAMAITFAIGNLVGTQV